MATAKGSGKAYRPGIGLMEVVRKFDTEEKAEAWFVAQRWPNGVACPHCESDNIATVKNRRPQPYRCRSCRKHFSVKTKTLLHSSNIPLSKWAIAFYLYSTNLKGVSSVKLHRDLGISQSSAWYMGHRIRGMWDANADKKLRQGRGSVGKMPVAGVKNRDTGQVSVAVVPVTNKVTMQGFIKESHERGHGFHG